MLSWGSSMGTPWLTGFRLAWPLLDGAFASFVVVHFAQLAKACDTVAGDEGYESHEGKRPCLMSLKGLPNGPLQIAGAVLYRVQGNLSCLASQGMRDSPE